MNGGAVTEDEPCTTPASPEPLNVASRAVLVKLPCPAPLLDAEPAVMPDSSNVSVDKPSAFVDIPAPRTIGDFARMIVCVTGLVSPTMVGASLLPVTVNVTGSDELTPLLSVTVMS